MRNQATSMLPSPFKTETSPNRSPSSTLFSLLNSLQLKSQDLMNSPVIGSLTPYSPGMSLFTNEKLTSPLTNLKWNSSILSPVLVTPIQLKSSYRQQRLEHLENNKISSFDTKIVEMPTAENSGTKDNLQKMEIEATTERNLAKEIKEEIQDASKKEKISKNKIEKELEQEIIKDEETKFESEIAKASKQKKKATLFDFDVLFNKIAKNGFESDYDDEYLMTQSEELTCLKEENQDLSHKIKFLKKTRSKGESVGLWVHLGVNLLDSKRTEAVKNEIKEKSFKEKEELKETNSPIVLKKKIMKTPTEYECEVCGKSFLKELSRVIGRHMVRSHHKGNWKLTKKIQTKNVKNVGKKETTSEEETF